MNDRERSGAPPITLAPNGRADERGLDRRGQPSPAGTRRQPEAGREYGYPPHPPPPGGAHMREREPQSREEWEARERRNGAHPPGGTQYHGQPMMGSRGPSPRIPDRSGLQQPGGLRRQPSPRVPSDPREYGRDPNYPYPPPHPDDRRRYEEMSMMGGNRHPSMPRDARLEETRIPSPAPSNSSRAGKRTRDSAGPGPVKRAKDDKGGAAVPSKRNSQNGEKKKEPKKAAAAKSPAESVKTAPPAGRVVDEGEQTVHQ
jgi:hypothetical protein